jgi:DNA-binding transcriptional MerR regulator
MDKTYTPSQICEKFGIVKSTLLRWEKEGLIPIPGRNLRGERQYSHLHIMGIGQYIQQNQHRKRFEQILIKKTNDSKQDLKVLGEENALFKFIHLRDCTGLAELKEYAQLDESTIHQLIRTASEDYSPKDDIFWEIIELVYNLQMN